MRRTGLDCGAAIRSCAATWLARIHERAHITDASTAGVFSVLELDALRTVALSVMRDAAQQRTAQLVRWSQTPASASASDAGGDAPNSTMGPAWEMPSEITGDASVTTASLSDLDTLLLVWSVQAVVSRWQPTSSMPMHDVLHQWCDGLTHDVKPLIDFFWQPCEDASRVPVLRCEEEDGALSTTHVCFLWSSILFLTFCQLAPCGDSAWFRETAPAWHANVVRSVERLLAEAQTHAHEGSAMDAFCVARVADQLRSLVQQIGCDKSAGSQNEVCATRSSVSSPAPLYTFVEALFTRTHASTPTSASSGLSERVYHEKLAPLWPSPLSLTRFRSAVVRVAGDNSYQSVYSTLAARRADQARSENDINVGVDGDDLAFITRVHGQLTDIARQGGNKPLV